jgi:CubicO group peptidase (beta-lactamase class C family)
MFIKRIFLSAVLFLGCMQIQAQVPAPKIDAWLSDHAQAMGGRVLLMVYKDGKIIYSHAASNMSERQKRVGELLARRQGKPVSFDDFTPSTRMPIASCSKWLSAALVMTFVDEGKLRLTDTVGKYLPVLSQNGKGNITISQCLSHLTGIKPKSLIDDLSAMRNVNSMDEAIKEISGLSMEGEPGKTFHYSNAGLQIAGAVIEKISGKDFGTLFTERIARPLGMEHTDYGETKVPLPAGGAQSTPEDYMHFLIMILNKGMYNGRRILSENSVAQMQVNRITDDVRIMYSPAETGKLGYGYGEWVMGSNYMTSPGLFGSYPWLNNDEKYCAFLMAYSLNSKGRHENYMELTRLVETELIK